MSTIDWPASVTHWKAHIISNVVVFLKKKMSSLNLIMRKLWKNPKCATFYMTTTLDISK